MDRKQSSDLLLRSVLQTNDDIVLGSVFDVFFVPSSNDYTLKKKTLKMKDLKIYLLN